MKERVRQVWAERSSLMALRRSQRLPIAVAVSRRMSGLSPFKKNKIYIYIYCILSFGFNGDCQHFTSQIDHRALDHLLFQVHNTVDQAWLALEWKHSCLIN